mmetsp:Transcript_29592/g.70510  ORF Transcript_29592/g.70510 Transcript_29592/m.70510 type:complete len:285 (+) Transcript_29592:317-1171(+)
MLALSSRRIRICASFWGLSFSQRIPGGFWCNVPVRMTCVGVTTMSTGTSCSSICPSSMSSTSCRSWTVVTTRVCSSTAPIHRMIPYSSSAKPSPFPMRHPLAGFTATLPTTTSPTRRSSCSETGAPCSRTPAEVQANGSSALAMRSLCSVEKKPVRSRGCGVTSVLPPPSTRIRTPFWGVSGLTLITSAFSNSWRAANRCAASSAPAKLGILWSIGLGSRATPFSSRSFHTLFRMGHFQDPGPEPTVVAASESAFICSRAWREQSTSLRSKQAKLHEQENDSAA